MNLFSLLSCRYSLMRGLRDSLKSAVGCCLILVLAACQTFSDKSSLLDQHTLASLKPAVINEVAGKSTVNNIGLVTLIDHYTKLLPLLDSPDEKMKVLHRLADLKMQNGEQLMADEAVDELSVAVEAYNGLLVKYPASNENDEILYQLAKTYELKGLREKHLETLTRLVSEYPKSRHYVEVQFRRGELLFSDDKFEAAELAFADVASSDNSVFKANAFYMHGWSLFKQARYSQALESYIRVLDLLLATRDAEAIQSNQLARELVDKSYQTLVDDLLRVSALSVSYLGGAVALSELFEQLGPRAYEHIVFGHYAKFLEEKEQFSDAIAAYQRYIERNSLNSWAPQYHLNAIDILKKAGFKRDIYQEKVRFVDSYGITSEYWSYHDSAEGRTGAGLQVPIIHLEKLLIELADRHYVNAQNVQKRSGLRGESKYTKEYFESIRYNQEFIKTFSSHELVAERTFLIGESYLAIKNYQPAIDNFVAAGYNFSDYNKATESAYAAILAYDTYSKSWKNLKPVDRQTFEELQQANRLKFVAIHRADARAVGVLLAATDYLYKRQDYSATLVQAKRLIHWSESFDGATKVDSKTNVEAHIYAGHSEYALKSFVASEQTYLTLLGLLQNKDKRRTALSEKLAASVFNQGEAKVIAGDLAGAVDEFLRIGHVVPSSKLRPGAEYDATGYLIQLKQWDRAIEVLISFRKRYPKHKLINTIPAKLALAYRETSQWENAAAELKKMRELAKTEEERKDLQFIVAELYDKAKNKQQAILSYRLWANTYQEPADVYMEVTNRLAELYLETDKPLKRRFWLAKQMKKVDGLGDKADDRMRFLAAKASSVLANDAFIQYKRIKLKLPLNVSLEKKTKALEKAMKAYQKTASYGVSSYATEAGYRMADIYAQLSRDLMDSDRPDGLDELAMEQYEILLEEQAYPFEDSAIDIHEQNASRSWNGIYDEWVKNSFTALKELLPGRYDKPEAQMEVMDAMF